MIGPFVFCPRCGARLTQQFLFGRERPVCPACGYIVFYDPKVAVGALVEHEGKVLLVRRRYDPGKGGWALPAGFVEIDEGPVAAAIRECREDRAAHPHLRPAGRLRRPDGSPGSCGVHCVSGGSGCGGSAAGG